MSQRLAAISVDLDEIPCYTAIHGLGTTAPQATAHAIYERAVPRFEALFAELEIAATFFVIGSDLGHDDSRHAAQRLHTAGHELGNHSMHHLYDLTRQPAEILLREVADAATAIESVTGRAPLGFRAPGYTINDQLLRLLATLGYRYDSSVFPCPSYYAAKAAAMLAMRCCGRHSRSVLDDPRVLRAPIDPYRIGTPYWRAGDGMLELPIGVTTACSGRLPFIGTSLMIAGRGGSRWLTRRMIGRQFVHLELHGIDLADACLDGLEFLRPHQPDLRRSAAEKTAVLREVIQELRQHGYKFVTLAKASEVFAQHALRSGSTMEAI